jgi:prepilin-type N-terminal cleavage/methylation domain-containing protein
MRKSERGYTLLEMIVVVAIITVFLAGIAPSFSQNPGVITGSIGMVQTAIDEASSLAFANGTDTPEAGRGATIQFTIDPQTGETVGQVYWGRPYNSTNGSIPIVLKAEDNLPEIRTKTHIRIEVSGVLVDPPFAMFISPSGHASTIQGVVTTKLVPSENSCVGSFPMEFSLGTDVRTRQISCEYTAMLPNPQPSGATSGQSSTNQSP